MPGDTLIHLGAQPVSAIRDLCSPAGQERFFQEVSILGDAVGPVHLALACLLDQPDDPWFVGSSEPTDARPDGTSTACASTLNPAFAMKNRAAIRSTPVNWRRALALERLILILAIATLHLTSVGAGVVQAGKQRWVDPIGSAV